ncbi:unnamed protein product [Arctia plantaginis]|uniref:Reverse transcriptase domain-containing protein n=1 Tax=Arctia plantaginis TaxID=874455 RepID=A0A8S0YU77_ARCPL|nr:unnamed protein product [Arctia plantaginis]CAB3247842.1 unnamed protein product [Arctia plantaginis]
MLRYQQILGLSEVRRNGFSKLRTPKGWTFLYSGKESEEDTLEYGVGLLLSDAAKKSLLDRKLNSTPKRKPLKSKDRQLIATSDHQLRCGREHFEEVFRSTTPIAPDTPQHTSLPSRLLDIKVDPPTHDAVAKAIPSLKIGKAPGLDLVTAEILNADLSSAVKVLAPLIKRIWTKEELPYDWNKGLLITMPKKGDLSQCSNWRGITLLSVPSKVFCKIILDRLSVVVEPLLRKEQAGFRPNRSCIDQINTLRIILEQASEWQREVNLTFVDFEKAFDTRK